MYVSYSCLCIVLSSYVLKYRVYRVNENCRSKFVLVRSLCPYCQVLVVGITRARVNGRYMIKNVLAK